MIGRTTLQERIFRITHPFLFVSLLKEMGPGTESLTLRAPVHHLAMGPGRFELPTTGSLRASSRETRPYKTGAPPG